MNPDLVTNIKVIKNLIKMQTNAGSSKIVFKGQVRDHIKAQFDTSHIANLFGFAHITEKY